MRSLIHLFLALVLLTAAALSQTDERSSAYQSAGTKKMAALLRQIYEQNDWKADPNKPAQRAAYYRALLQKDLAPAQEVTVRLELGKELLRAGDSENALRELENLAKSCRDRGIHLPTDMDRQLRLFIALSYLRLGEQENCASMHGQKSCIFPIHGSGVHALPRGAEGAVKEFTNLLQEDPNDDASRWLLNIAYMQLGKYPQSVPAKWLIPADRFNSEYDIGDFLDVAPQAGVAA